MNMTQKLMILMLALLALTSCKDSKDEPTPTPPNPVEETTTMYFATSGFYGYPEEIYNIDGYLVYQCEDTECSIQSLTTDGRDWYAVIIRGDGVYNVIKNGTSIYLTGDRIWGIAVENGTIYTIQEHTYTTHSLWVYKDFQRWYEVVGDVYYNMSSIHDGKVAMGVYDELPYYWCNGEILPVDGLDEGFNWIYGIDLQGDDLLITYESIQDLKNKYWWNGKNYDLTIYPRCSKLINGHAVIVGRKTTEQQVGGITGVAAVIIDGEETTLSDEIGTSAEQLVGYGQDIYILVRERTGPVILKNMQSIMLPDIEIPEDLKQAYHDSGFDKINLKTLGVECFAVAMRPYLPD